MAEGKTPFEKDDSLKAHPVRHLIGEMGTIDLLPSPTELAADRGSRTARK